MSFATWAIRKPTPSILLFIVLTVVGLTSFRQLGVQNMPDVDYPVVIITAVLPGGTPAQVETEVTRKIEDAVAGVGQVRHIRSTLVEGSSTTSVEFEFEKELDQAVIDVRDAVARIRAELPTDLREPVISRVTVIGDATLTYAVSATGMDEADLSWFVDDTVSKKLLPVSGVGRVTRRGGVNREIAVELDPVRLQAMQVTAGEVSRQLRAVQQEAPGGRGAIGGFEQSMRTIASAGSAEALAAMIVPSADGRQVRLDEVAGVRDTLAERRQLALLDGKPVVSFQVFRSRGFDDVGVADRVREAVDALRGEHPRISIVEVSNVTDSIEEQYRSAMHALYEGALLAIVVVWLFLRDWRATLVSAVALPMSVIPTFFVMQLLGYPLNMVTLLALTLVVGLLVDDAIVEVENIVRHLRMGKPPLQAARDAAEEIGLAVIATSMALVAVFLPTAFMSDVFGLFFRQFGITASVAVLASLLVARLLTPMMSAYFLRPKHELEPEGPWMQRYLRAVRWCLRYPRAISAAAGGFFLASLGVASLMSTAVFIAPDMSRIRVTVEATPGSTLEQTHGLAEQARLLLVGIPELRSVYTTIGAGGGFGQTSDVHSASLLVQLVHHSERRRKQKQIEAEARERLAALPGVRVSVLGTGLGGFLMQIALVADDAQQLADAAQAVERDLRTLSGVGSVVSSASLLQPEIVIRPDPARAAAHGVTTAAIAEALRVATAGDFDTALPKLNLPSRQVYIRAQLPEAARQDLDVLRQLEVRGSRGLVPLESVASLALEGGPSQITRYDRSSNVTLRVELQGRPLGDVLSEANRLPSLSALPPGVQRVNTGDTELQASMVVNFLAAMVAGVFCLYAVLILLFHDFAQPVTILAALPLASGGALGILAILGHALSMSTLIGLLMLLGIVAKNSILLVEYAIVARDQGMDRVEALVDACRKRARPIIMTTIAMIAGMLPMALDVGGDASFRAPMALAVIGGLITSTTLSLLVVPVVFEMVDDLKQRLRALLLRPEISVAD